MWQGTKTNLYHNHAECKYVRFPCDRIDSFGNLWRSPHRSVLIGLHRRVDSANDRSELKIRQTSVTVMIDENVGLAKGYRRGSERLEGNAHPFQVSVCDAVCVKILKAFGYVQQLGRMTLSVGNESTGQTDQANPLRIWVFLDEFHQSSARHPFRNDLERICCDANERDDVRVPQSFPNHGLFAE